MKEERHVSFYDKEGKEISRRTYRGTYGGMIYQARKRAKKIGAEYFWHKIYLRKFSMETED